MLRQRTLGEADPLLLAFFFAWEQLDRDPDARREGLPAPSSTATDGYRRLSSRVMGLIGHRLEDWLREEIEEALASRPEDEFAGAFEMLDRRFSKRLLVRDEGGLPQPVSEILAACTRRHESVQLAKLVEATINPGPNEVVDCLFENSALIAMTLATRCAVRLTLENRTLGHVAALLALGISASLQVRFRDPLHRDLLSADERQAHHVIVMPPALGRRGRGKDETPLERLFELSSRGWGIILLEDEVLSRLDLRLGHLAALHAVVSLPRGIMIQPGTPDYTMLVTRGKNPANEVLFVDARRFADQGEDSERRMRAVALDRLPSIAGLIREPAESFSNPAQKPYSALKARQDVQSAPGLRVDQHIMPTGLQALRTLGDENTIALNDVAEIIKPQFFAPPDKAQEMIEVREVAIADLRNGVVHRPERRIELPADLWRLKGHRYRLYPGDVLVSVKSRVGLVGVIPHAAADETWMPNQSFVILKLRQNSLITSDILATYLRSGMGQASMTAIQVGSSVPMISMGDIRTLRMPLFDEDVQSEIEDLVLLMAKKRDEVVSLEREISAIEENAWDLLFSKHGS